MMLSPLFSLLFTLSPQLAEPASAPATRPAKTGKATRPKVDAADQIPMARLTGAFADLPEQGLSLADLLAGGGTPPKGFYGLIEKLTEAGAEAGAHPLVLDLSGDLGINLAQTAELERCLSALRRNGRTCIAYLENASLTQFQVAACCDQVVMADMGTLDLRSLALSITFMKDALDLVGVQMDVVRCGDFKGAVEPYMLSSMSKHLREHYRSMLDRMNHDVVRRVAMGRKMAPERVRQLQGTRIFSAKQALELGLVDRLVPWAGPRQGVARVLGKDQVQFKDVLAKDRKKKNVDLFSLVSNLLNPKDEAEDVEGPTLAVLHLSGDIVDGTTAQPGSIVSGPMVKTIREIQEKSDIKGVVVRVNSPGGSATASEAILLALKELARTKPVVVSMGSIAGSGGYYVTCLGRPILAEAGTLTGSIGVFGMKPNLGALFRRIGLNNELIALDESAGMDATDRGWTTEEKERIQAYVDEVYTRFVDHVAASRKLARDEVLKIAGGRVWSGDQAVTLHLVDKLGGIEDALDLVAKEAGVGKEREIVHLPRPRGMFDSFAQELMEVRALLGERLPLLTAARDLGLSRALRLVTESLRATTPLQVWALVPEELRIR